MANIYMRNMNPFYIFTDGNCKSNGRKDAKAAFSVYFSDQNPYSEFNTTQRVIGPTNNVAELLGVQYIFKILNDHSELFHSSTNIIVCDSLYSIKCIEQWSVQWEKNNWVNAKKEPVKNQILIKSILELRKKCIEKKLHIRFQHVLSHQKEPVDKTSLEWKLWYGNMLVDKNSNDLLNQ